MSDMQTCPMCAEEIKAAARICRHCGHEFPAPLPPPLPLTVDTEDAATLIFTGRTHSGETESTNLQILVFRREEGKLSEVLPLAIAAGGRWRPAGALFVAQPASSTARAGVLATHAVHTTDSRHGGVDEPFQVELLVPTGALEIGWAPVLRAAGGGELLDPTGCGSCPVQLTAGQTVVIDVGAVLAVRGLDAMGQPHLGFSGPPASNRQAARVQIASADADAQAQRWAGIDVVAPPSGRVVDPMLIVAGEAARQRWGHGASVFQADAAASGAAMGAKLGAAYAEKKRKKALLQGARAKLLEQVSAAGEGVCALLDERLAGRARTAEALVTLESQIEAGEGVQRDWDALVKTVDAAETGLSQANNALSAFAARLGEAVEASGDPTLAIDGVGGLLEVAAQIETFQAEHDALDGASGFFAKAKATAQQVALKAQIALATNKRGGLRGAVGRAVLSAGAEGSVGAGDSLVAEVAEVRATISGAEARRDQALAARDADRDALAGRLGLAALPDGGPASALAALRERHKAAQGERDAWQEQTADAMLLAGVEHWPAGGPLREALDDLSMKRELLGAS